MPTPAVTTEHFALRHSKRCRYTFLRTLPGIRSFEVKCNDCSYKRIIESPNGRLAYTPRKCSCAKKGAPKLMPKERAAKLEARYDCTLVKVLSDNRFKFRCNSCDANRTISIGDGNAKVCDCQRVKTGPKALKPKSYAAKHADRLDYKLLKVLEPRVFQVECLSCGKDRVLRVFRGPAAECVCKHKRKFYREKRTPATHTAEIHALGKTEYECLEVAGAKLSNVYRHKCGYEFSMTKDCFMGSHEPCGNCRELGYSHEEVASLAKARGLVLLDRYESGRDPKTLYRMRYRCGHVMHISAAYATRPHLDIPHCTKCHPTRTQFKGTVDGKRFMVRSMVEAKFIKYLVNDRGIDVNKVEYEPSDRKIHYYHPIKDKQARYTPDFAVGSVMVEVKDLASLGLKTYHWQDKEEALIENRAKYEAAVKAFDDYRVYVLIKGEFHRAYKFWTAKERQRLLAI